MVWYNGWIVSRSDAIPTKLKGNIHSLPKIAFDWREVHLLISCPSCPIHKDGLHPVTGEYRCTQVPLPNSARPSQTQNPGAVTFVVSLFWLSFPLCLFCHSYSMLVWRALPPIHVLQVNCSFLLPRVTQRQPLYSPPWVSCFYLENYGRWFCSLKPPSGSMTLRKEGFRIGRVLCTCCSVTPLCPTLWNSMDWSPAGSSIHGIF